MCEFDAFLINDFLIRVLYTLHKMRKFYSLIFFSLLTTLVFTSTTYASTQMSVLGFYPGNDPGTLSKIFFNPMPSETKTSDNCIIYNSSHNFVNNGSVMRPANGCSFVGATLPDGEYTIEILNQFGDQNNPVGISEVFYMINGKPSLVPPTSPTSTPENEAPQFYIPNYLINHAGDRYYQFYGFSDPDSSSWTGTVDYGDGSGEQPLTIDGTLYYMDHVYTSAGTYVIKVKITDNHGNVGEYDVIAAFIEIPDPQPSLSITNFSYVYDSPNKRLLTISFTPDATFYSCYLVVNADMNIVASSKTANSCTFNTSSIDYKNLSLYFYGDPQGSTRIRSNSFFYTTTTLLDVPRVVYNSDNIYVETNVPMRETCHLINASGNVVATTELHIPSNSCLFNGVGYGSGNSLPDGNYRLYLPQSGLGYEPITISKPSLAPTISSINLPTLIQTDMSFESSTNFSDPNINGNHTAVWNWGDGTTSNGVISESNGSGVVAGTHAYTATGTYTVTLTLTDDGGMSDIETAEITVANTLEPVTLYPTADSYIKQGSSNENEGSSSFMRLQSTGHNRSLVKFDQSQIETAVNGAQNYTAKLQFAISDNGNNWGSTGRPISLHRLIQDWTEGNGFNDGNNPSFRGTGNGITWSCSTDSNIQNTSKNCTGGDEWNMTNSSLWPFASAATATTTITNNQTGVVEFDVTSDVQSFISGANTNTGWLLKKVDEGQNGRVEFGTKESGNTPTLIISFN